MKTLKILSVINYLVLSLSFINCNGNGSKNREEDTIIDSSAIPKEIANKEPTRLPDTIYPSAKSGIDFKVMRVDTTTTEIISSLKDLYADTPGAFTFRKGSMRQADFGGKVSGRPSEFVIDWVFKTEENFTETKFGIWGGGTGWTGQPVFVEWPDSLLKKMKENKAVNEDFTGKEIIFGSLCGNVYFVDFTTGKASRNPIPGQNPIKGSISLDPSLNGNLYVGQGVPVERPFGVFMVDLFTNKIDFFRPEDPKAYRHWGAFDSSAICLGQFLFHPGENGSLYKYNVMPGKLELHSVMRYRVSGAAPGIESSMAIYRNYGYISDNHGNIIGINLDTLQPAWLYKIGDDTDCTPVIVEENGIPYLYLGCEIDRQGEDGTANFVKLNALDGSEIWKLKLQGHKKDLGEKHFDGGYFSSPLLGDGNCSELIFAQCVRNTKGQNGEFIAINRTTGDIVYTVPLKHYAWLSPVRFMNEKGEMFVVTGDCIGNMYIIEGKTGEIIYSERVGNNFESSPVVSGNTLVVGSRGNSIFKITLK